MLNLEYKIQYNRNDHKNTVKYGGMWTESTRQVLSGEKCIRRICKNDCSFCTIQSFGIYDLINKFQRVKLRHGLSGNEFIDLVNSWLYDNGYDTTVIRCQAQRIARDNYYQPANLAKWIKDIVRDEPNLNNYFIPIKLVFTAESDFGHYFMLGTENNEAVILESQTGDSRNMSLNYTVKYIYNQSSQNFLDSSGNNYFDSRGTLYDMWYFTIVDKQDNNKELKVVRINEDRFYLTTIDGTYVYDPRENREDEGEDEERGEDEGGEDEGGGEEELRFSLIEQFFDQLYTYNDFKEVWGDDLVSEKWDSAVPEHRYSTVDGFGHQLYSYQEFLDHWGDEAYEQWNIANRIRSEDKRKGRTLLEYMQQHGQKKGIHCWNNYRFNCNFTNPQELRYSTVDGFRDKLYSYQAFLDHWGEDANRQWQNARRQGGGGKSYKIKYHYSIA